MSPKVSSTRKLSASMIDHHWLRTPMQQKKNSIIGGEAEFEIDQILILAGLIRVLVCVGTGLAGRHTLKVV